MAIPMKNCPSLDIHDVHIWTDIKSEHPSNVYKDGTPRTTVAVICKCWGWTMEDEFFRIVDTEWEEW